VRAREAANEGKSAERQAAADRIYQQLKLEQERALRCVGDGVCCTQVYGATDLSAITPRGPDQARSGSLLAPEAGRRACTTDDVADGDTQPAGTWETAMMRPDSHQ